MPTLHSILVNLTLLAASSGIAYLAARARRYIPEAIAYYKAHTTAQERTMLSDMASTVVPYVERVFADLAGSEQMKTAVSMVDAWLKTRDVPITAEEIEAAIEKAYADAKRTGLLSMYPPKPTATPATK